MDSRDRRPDRAPESRPSDEARQLPEGLDALFAWERAAGPPPAPDDFPSWDAAGAGPAPALPECYHLDEPPLPGGPLEEPDLESMPPGPARRARGPLTDARIDIPILPLPGTPAAPLAVPAAGRDGAAVPDLLRLLDEMSPVPAAWLRELAARASGDGADAPPAFVAAAEEGEPHLVFDLAGAEYAIALANVREIAQAPLITPLPRVPDWLLGVSNVRGDILSVIDLRLFLGLDDPGPQRAGRLLVVTGRGEPISTGLRIDAVREIARLTDAAPAADVEPRVRPFLRGVARRGSRRLRVLDVERFLSSAELRQFEPV